MTLTRSHAVFIAVLAVLLVLPTQTWAQGGNLPALTVVTDGKGQSYSLSIQVVILMTLLTLLPAALMMMTAFTRIIIVLAILRQAIGLVQTPSSQTLVGLALFLTVFVMAPVLDKINQTALQPYLEEKISMEAAIDNAKAPLRTFMLGQTREADLQMFSKIAGQKPVDKVEDIPFTILVPSFVTSELKTAFQIGFLLFIPFLIIDLVVSSVLMSMGMMMLSPMVISLPFKIMLFVLVDGWTIVMGTLASSFYV
jgi:flagellar biosynthesis protein FliP